MTTLISVNGGNDVVLDKDLHSVLTDLQFAVETGTSVRFQIANDEGEFWVNPAVAASIHVRASTVPTPVSA